MACEACIRGHRVSGCNHSGQFLILPPGVAMHVLSSFNTHHHHQQFWKRETNRRDTIDRKLLPIAKKGRPVSQCSHCRHMRKSRSAHVKCDCGERLAFLKEQAKNGKPVPSAGSCHATGEDGDAKSEPLSAHVWFMMELSLRFLTRRRSVLQLLSWRTLHMCTEERTTPGPGS